MFFAEDLRLENVLSIFIDFTRKLDVDHNLNTIMKHPDISKMKSRIRNRVLCQTLPQVVAKLSSFRETTPRILFSPEPMSFHRYG